MSEVKTTAIWEDEPLGEYLSLLSGFPFPSNKFSDKEGFPLIRIRDILDQEIETYFLGDFSPLYVIRSGDVLVGMDGDFNVTRWTQQDALLNQRVLKVGISNTSKADLGFVFYWLHGFIRKVNEVTAATTVKHLSVKDVRKGRARIPDVFTQQKIARILQTVDRAMEKTEALIEKYQQIKAGLMHDLFTRGLWTQEELDRGDHQGTPAAATAQPGQLRPTRQDAPHLYQQTPIGWIPKAWEAKPLGQILSAPPKNGFSPKEVDEWEGLYALGLGCLTKSGFRSHQLKSAPKSAALSGALLKDGDFLISRSNTHELVGLCGIYRDVGGKAIYPDLMMRLQFNGSVIPQYVEKYLLWGSTRNKISAIAVGTSGSMVKINARTLSALEVAVPTPKEQLLLSSKLDKAKARIEGLVKEYTKLQKQKSGLMHDLLTGKVPVTPDSEDTDGA